jgi:hypothetical protein
LEKEREEEGTAQEPAEAAEERAEQSEETKQAGQAEHEEHEEHEHMPPPNVYAMLELMATMFAEQAWQFMGIRLAPGQKELVKDMAQAKVAIDTVVFVTDKLHPQLSEQDRTAIRHLVSDLQVNFVRQSQG